MKRTHIPATPPSVVAQIARLPDLPFTEIRALWRQLFGAEAPTHIRVHLERRIAYKLQENAFRQVNPELLEQNQQRINALIEATQQASKGSTFTPAPGTVLVREHQGVEHRVVVGTDGQFEYQGRRYRSLSRIALEITGTRWSGPLFFGLKERSPPKTKKTGGRA